jgi:CHAT domain-containing protein
MNEQQLQELELANVLSTANDSQKFLLEILLSINEKKTDSNEIYLYWEQQKNFFNETFLTALPQLVRKLLEAMAEQQFERSLSLILFHLGSLMQEFSIGESGLNLEISISAYKLALKTFTRSFSREMWARIQNELGILYGRRIRGIHASNMQQAKVHFRAALKVYNKRRYAENCSTIKSNLARVVEISSSRKNSKSKRSSARIGEEQNTKMIVEQLGYGRSAIVPFGHPGSFSGIVDELGDCDDLDLDVMAAEMVLGRIEGQNPDYRTMFSWINAKAHLAYAYHNRRHGKRHENIRHSIDLYRQVLPVIEKEFGRTELWVKMKNDLGTTYLDCLDDNQPENIENAIKCFTSALDMARKCTNLKKFETTLGLNLASAWRHRLIGDRIDNCDKAISEIIALLKNLTPETDRYLWAVGHLTLGNAYGIQIESGVRKKDTLKKAQDALESAQKAVTTEDEALWFAVHAALGNFYLQKSRYFAGGGISAESSEHAIKACELALEKVPLDSIPPEVRAQMYHNLGISYRMAYENGGHYDDLASAISYGRMALETHSSQHKGRALASLGNAHWLRSKIDMSEEEVRLTLGYYDEALRILTPEMFSYDCRGVSLNLGDIQSGRNNWQSAAGAYELALKAAENLYQSCLFIKNQLVELGKVVHLPHHAAYAYAKVGFLQENEEIRKKWLKRAIVTLDANRGRSLRESFDRDRADLTQLQKCYPELHKKYQEVLNQLRNFESQQRDFMVSDGRKVSTEDFHSTAKKLHLKRDQILAEIRQIASYKDFLMPTEWKDIEIALRPDSSLIYLVTTTNGSATLIVTTNGIKEIWNNNFTHTELQKMLESWVNAYPQGENDHDTWLTVINKTTHQLWDSFMGPIVEHLETLRIHCATLIPTGLLSLFPLHAAWTEHPSKPEDRRYALDDIHFTYTPNARSVTEARKIADLVKADTILAIDEPKHRYLDSDTRTFKPVNSLPNSSREVAKAIATFPNSNSKVLLHVEATCQAVLNTLPSINILHCSCHGKVNFQEPLKSGLAMTGDGEEAVLTLRDFLDLKLTDSDYGGIRLAILSACETGLPGLDNDEVFSLSTGLLQAGAAGVISSLWSVSELSTMLLLTKFYDFWQKHPDSPDRALREAQRWLRDSNPKDKVDHCAAFIPEVASPQSEEDKQLRRAIRLDYSNPYHWAAFSYTGI